GLPAAWLEYEAADPTLPAHARGYGSPTVLVDGADVSGAMPETSACCRLYQHGGDNRGAPSVEQIVETLRKAMSSGGAGGTNLHALGVVPALGISLLPSVACPSCWPAYSAVLSSMGVGALLDDAWLLPLTIGFLALALMGLAWGARSRRGYWPLMLGTAGAVLLVVAKFGFDVAALGYVGAATVAAASVWNAWPRSRGQRPPATLHECRPTQFCVS